MSTFQKSKSRFETSILEILCVPIFRQNGQLWIFGPKFSWKWILPSEFQKSNYGFGISTSTISCVLIFSQNGRHLVFWPRLGEIAQLRAIFCVKYRWGCCRELGGGGWRWVHSLVISFDDIFKNLSLVVSYTPVMLHSQWHYHCTRDIPVTRFHLMPFSEVEILVRGGGGRGRGCIPPYPLLPISHVCPCITPVHKLFAHLCCCLGLQLHWK